MGSLGYIRPSARGGSTRHVSGDRDVCVCVYGGVRACECECVCELLSLCFGFGAVSPWLYHWLNARQKEKRTRCDCLSCLVPGADTADTALSRGRLLACAQLEVSQLFSRVTKSRAVLEVSLDRLFSLLDEGPTGKRF